MVLKPDLYISRNSVGNITKSLHFPLHNEGLNKRAALFFFYSLYSFYGLFCLFLKHCTFSFFLFKDNIILHHFYPKIALHYILGYCHLFFSIHYLLLCCNHTTSEYCIFCTLIRWALPLLLLTYISEALSIYKVQSEDYIFLLTVRRSQYVFVKHTNLYWYSKTMHQYFIEYAVSKVNDR